MAHNSFVRGGTGSGSWTNYTVLHGVLEQIDQYLFESINGDQGGTWAPAARIILGGLGLNVTGVCILDGVNTINGATTFTSSATFGTVVVNGAISFNASVGFIAGTTTGNAAAVLNWGGDYTFSHTGLFSALVSMSAGLSISAGTVALGSQVNVGAGFKFLSGSTPIVEEKFKLNAGGHIKYRYVVGAAADHTYAIADADLVVVQAGSLPGTVNYTLSNTGCVGGETITIMNNDGAQEVTIRQHNGTTILMHLKQSLTFLGITAVNNGSGSGSAGWEIIDYAKV